jgi:hypothetical protein
MNAGGLRNTCDRRVSQFDLWHGSLRVDSRAGRPGHSCEERCLECQLQLGSSSLSKSPTEVGILNTAY